MKKRILVPLLSAFAVCSLASCDHTTTDVNNPTIIDKPSEDNNNSKQGQDDVNKKNEEQNNDENNNQKKEKVEKHFETPEIKGEPVKEKEIKEEHFETPEIEGEKKDDVKKDDEKKEEETSNATITKTHFNDSLKTNGPLTQNGCPSIGNPKVLVVPVNLDESNKTDEVLNDIKLSFNGTSEETGWESVASYYTKSSYGKLNFEFEVTDWFTPAHNDSYYENYNTDKSSDGQSVLLQEVLEAFDPSYDFNDYDLDKDGYIDLVWIIYNRNFGDSRDSFYWANQSTVDFDKTFDGVKAHSYGFASSYFMHRDVVDYPTDSFVVDAHIYIHETGHTMGLEDYYDYDDNVGYANGELYEADMMDNNKGDHNSMSKLLLGWVDPIVVSGKGKADYTLESFTTTGDVILVANHEIKSIYDEYFLIEFYTNDGLNYNDTPIFPYDTDANGIRILHVNAQKNFDESGNVVAFNDGIYPKTGFKYNNSTTDVPMVTHLTSSKVYDYIDSTALYTDISSTFGEDTYKDYKLNDGSTLPFTLPSVGYI
ncbi:MAG: hypothetical protein K6E99_03970 [Bacilli bacterium]|nr:hypothetical protein [Bacilli bacterium]